MLLPCEDSVLRAAATQRPNKEVGKNDFLPMRVEKALTQLLVRETKLQLKVDSFKRVLECSYDFSYQNAFKSIDDWNYQYLDNANIKRFLRKCGYVAGKEQLVSIIRRFDTDGDAKINLKEFSELLKSSQHITSKYQSATKSKKSVKTSNAFI